MSNSRNLHSGLLSWVLLVLVLLSLSTREIKAQSVMKYPVGGEDVIAGSMMSIVWDTQLVKGLVNVNLWDGSRATSFLILKDIPAEEGHIEWSVPPNFEGKRFRIRLSADSLIGSGLTKTFFQISKAALPELSVQNHSVQPLSVLLYPNPTGGKLTINLDSLVSEDPISIEVFNAIGERVIENSWPHISQGLPQDYVLDCSKLISGAYIMRIETALRTRSIRFLKK